MTERAFPAPREIPFEEARLLPIPDGLTAQGEYDWLVYEQRVFPMIATSVVHERRPDEWPPDGEDHS